MMKSATCLAMFLFAGCAINPPSYDPADVSGMVSVSTEGGPRGQVCPIMNEFALTASHVSGATIYNFVGSKRERLSWDLFAEINGQSVHLKEWAFDRWRDLAIVHMVHGPGFPKVYNLAKELPMPGQRLWIRGFNVLGGFSERPIMVETVNVKMGYLFYYPAGTPGSSGSCVLNEDDEVVAINAFSFKVRAGAAFKELGGGAIVVGSFGLGRFPSELGYKE